MAKIALIVIALLGLNSKAAAQLTQGSVAVGYFSDKKLIIAADSRAIDIKGGTPDDTKCKIAVLGGKVIFVSTGGAGYSTIEQSDPVQGWNNIDEARRAYEMIVGKSENASGHTRAVANQWAELMVTHFVGLNLFHPDRAASIAYVTHGVPTIALFGGRDLSGNLELISITITLVPNRIPAVAFGSPPVACTLCVIGEADVPIEFIHVTSGRAKLDAKHWRAFNDSSTSDYDIRHTMHFVELTEKYHASNVGGPIDAVQLTREGNLRWLSRKKNCQAD
jgi:hypothetical protein